ncbi:MAG: hypothetical protein Q8O98_02560, partial [bacterium]|nr:hypothetical protein [bacterium]
AFPFTLAASAIVIIYLITIETGGSKGSEARRKVMLWPAIALCTISLLFVINPTVSGTYGELSETVSATFGIVNSDVRPSFSATFNVARQVLEKGLFFGAGPNSFSSSWLLYKPQELNNTIFWDTSFPYGIGFIPTQAASVGAVGILVWLSFIILFLIVGIKAMAKLPENVWQRFGVVTTFLGALLLWLINVVYTPSIVMFGLAFIFTGLFLAALGTSGIISSKRVTFRHSAAINFGSALTIVALCVGSVALGFVVLQRSMSFLHYQKALVLSGTAGASVVDIENELAKAIRLVPQDTYYRALSQIQFSKAQSVFTRTTGTQAENQEAFRSALTASIAAAQAAIDKNSKNYGNWVNLAIIYS